jgi:hypothetical protein
VTTLEVEKCGDFSIMSKRLWVALSGFVFFEAWVSISYVATGRWVIGLFATLWTLFTVLAVGNFYFERLEQAKKPA